jgi:hypothetical protein
MSLLWELFRYYAWTYETFLIRTGLLESKKQLKWYAFTDDSARDHLYDTKRTWTTNLLYLLRVTPVLWATHNTLQNLLEDMVRRGPRLTEIQSEGLQAKVNQLVKQAVTSLFTNALDDTQT